MVRICVVGSVNMDFFSIADRFPLKGETITGTDFSTQPGGKGANQAVAAARLGAKTFFIGACGNDSIYHEQLENFKSVGVNTEGLEVVSGPSGVAQITIAENDNSIIVIPGANGKLNSTHIDKHKNIIDQCDVLIVQLEIPLETVMYAVNYAHSIGKKIILNPAPARKLPAELIEKCDYITPNEIEIREIFNVDEEEALKQYPNKVIMTKGKEGVYFNDGIELVRIAAEDRKVVDTTGAGDTFNGAFAFAIGEGRPLMDSIVFANHVASMSITKLGAQSAMPSMEEILNG